MDLEEFYNLMDVMHITFGDMTKAKIFLLVCREEGITQTEIANVLHIPQPSASRHVLKLTKRMVVDGSQKLPTYKEEGLGYCKCLPDPVEPKKLAVFLTDEGRKFLGELKNYLDEGD